MCFPFDMEKAVKNPLGWLTSYARRRQLENSIEWLGRKPLDAHIAGNYPNLYMMTKRDENALAVGLWNMFDDRIDNAKICVSDNGDVEYINCSGHREGNNIVLDTTLYPFEFAGFVITTGNFKA